MVSLNFVLLSSKISKSKYWAVYRQWKWIDFHNRFILRMLLVSNIYFGIIIIQSLSSFMKYQSCFCLWLQWYLYFTILFFTIHFTILYLNVNGYILFDSRRIQLKLYLSSLSRDIDGWSMNASGYLLYGEIYSSSIYLEATVNIWSLHKNVYIELL